MRGIKMNNNEYADKLLFGFAARAPKKYGDDAAMLESLKQGYIRSSFRKRRRVRMFSAIAAAAAVFLAVFVPLAVSASNEMMHGRADGLVVSEVTAGGLTNALNAEPGLIGIEGYAPAGYKTYKDKKGGVKAYSVTYRSGDATAYTYEFEVICVFDVSYVILEEKNIDDKGENTVVSGIGIRIYIDTDNVSKCSFVLDVKYVVTLDKYKESVLQQIIVILDR